MIKLTKVNKMEKEKSSVCIVYSFSQEQILPPNVVTRVSEYVPQIISFVQKIIDNGFAYESNGSIYFDVATFDAHPNHYYAKLVPEAFGNQAALHEGEGDLSISSDRLQEKRSPNDFALWKASKPGEPAWPSPWGSGRPGWHIECSAMAAALLGGCVDIHTGGVDLKFPHHDNELAQSEAYYNSYQWVSYFLHTGHLHIDGCKMSKSLKNFITIKQALQDHTPSQIRMAFLLHSWKDTLDYSSNTIEGARQYLKMVSEFGLNVIDTVRRMGPTPNVWSPVEVSLHSAFQITKLSVHKALCDSIDTRAALDSMRDLVSESNKYMNNNTQMNTQLLQNISSYVEKMLRVFGVPLGDHSSAAQSSEMIVPLAQLVGEIREQLRQIAREKDIDVKTLQARQLELCDRIRDEMLPPLGIRLEDRDEGAPSVKVVSAAELMHEIVQKKSQEEARRLEKEEKKKSQAAAQQVEEVKDPKYMFHTPEYSAWNENGIPIRDKGGKEITKSQTKKLTKQMEAQRKKFEKWQEKHGGN